MVTLAFTAMPQVGTINITPDYIIKRAVRMEPFTATTDKRLRGLELVDYFEMPRDIQAAVAARFADQASPAMASEITGQDGRQVSVSLSTYHPRGRTPKSIRLTFRTPEDKDSAGRQKPFQIKFAHLAGPLACGSRP